MSQRSRLPVKVVHKRPTDADPTIMLMVQAAPSIASPQRQRHYQPRPFLRARRPASVLVEERSHGLVIKRTTALWLLIAGGAVFLLFVTFAVPRLINWDAVGRMIGPSCTIGLGNAGTKMTVKGWQAQSICDRIRTNPAGGINAYVTDGSTNNQVEMCRYVRAGSIVIVYGSGSSDVVSTFLCTQIQNNN